MPVLAGRGASWAWAVVAASGVILAALYLMWAYQRSFHGEPDEISRSQIHDLTLRERLVIGPFLVVIVFMGVYPKPFLDRIDPSVKALISHVEAKTDRREPAVAANGGSASVSADNATEGAAPSVADSVTDSATDAAADATEGAGQ